MYSCAAVTLSGGERVARVTLDTRPDVVVVEHEEGGLAVRLLAGVGRRHSRRCAGRRVGEVDVVLCMQKACASGQPRAPSECGARQPRPHVLHLVDVLEHGAPSSPRSRAPRRCSRRRTAGRRPSSRPSGRRSAPCSAAGCARPPSSPARRGRLAVSSAGPAAGARGGVRRRRAPAPPRPAPSGRA